MKAVWIVTVLIAAAALMGCEQKLLSDKQPRTQYERYDRLRGRYVPPTQRGPYGEEVSALRERLGALHQ